MSATCCAQQCCDLLRSNVAIVWPELANAGPTLLRCVALRCCYCLAGAVGQHLSLVSVASTRGMTTPSTWINIFIYLK